MTDPPSFRSDARLANNIETTWQDRWEQERTFWAPNPPGALLADVNADRAALPKLYVLDMFPYPSGAGLHVGHPLGYIGTDVYARFQRMNGHNVLHAMGYDAFGLPAEQYAVQTGQHPRATTEANIANMRRQLRALGLGHDPRRGIATTDVRYYRWTQWIFLQLCNAWYDGEADKARPMDELVAQFESGQRDDELAKPWSELAELDRRAVVDGYRLAYIADAPVNWCPALGTVLANEEVNSEGRSERGDHPVYKRPLRQWMLRITAYSDRLLADLDLLDWPEPIKVMQRNWIGRSTGAGTTFPVEGHDGVGIEVFTTRPDTLFGATYMVLAPEHPLVDVITPDQWPDGSMAFEEPLAWKGLFGTDRSPEEAVWAYREFADKKTDLERQAEGREKTGVFTGAFAENPTNGKLVPVFIADYVLMGYGTGAIMAVPAHDQRDFEFAHEFELPLVGVVRPPDSWLSERGLAGNEPADDWPEAYAGDGIAMNSANEEVSLDGLDTADAKATILEWLERTDRGEATVTSKLRDWLFSRQRYWGEPFPIVYDADGAPHAVPESMLPVELPDIENFEPKVSDDADALPEPPLARAVQWVEVELDLGDGPQAYRRETNTMPQWAGSCWYYLRYLDPTNDDEMVGRVAEQYWMGDNGIDLYVGGVEHAVLHLLYARFWHKVLYDLGHVSTLEPFGRLFNQGYIQAYAYRDERGFYVEATEVEERDGRYFHADDEVAREYGKMGKSLRNIVTPDDIYDTYGADTLRLYEMFMGPLDASRPWSTTDIIGVHRFLQRLWRNLVDEETGAVRVSEEPTDDETRRLLHATIDAVRNDMAGLSFNTAIARLFELNNRVHQVVTERGALPREVAEPLTLMVAPLAPHIAEELWSKLGHAGSLAYETFPEADASLLVHDTIEVPVQVMGKVRGRVIVPADATEAELEAAALGDERIATLLGGKTVRRVVVVPGRLVNIVTD
jgi:leucyl-tRNA synthetase